MRTRSRAMSMLAIVYGVLSSGPVGADVAGLTLDEALRGVTTHPQVRAAEADLGVADGELQTAKAFPNPEASFAVAPETDEETGVRDYDAAIGQILELGKRGKRVRGAEERRAAAAARLDGARLQVAAQVRRAYSLALAAEERVDAAREAESVADELRTAARERLELGAGTQLEVNVAAAAAGRARGERLAAERSQRQALAALAAAMGVAAPPAALAGTLMLPPALATREDDLVTLALAARPDVKALRHERAAADADLSLAKSLSIPDPTLGASVERTPDEHRFLIGVTLPIPLFNRNQGGRAMAKAMQSRATVTEHAATQAIEREVRTAYQAFGLARDAVQGFDRDVVERLGENLNLARQSFQAGKISLFDFNLLRRDLVETQIAYLDAVAELIEARYSLELAAGTILE